MTQHTMRARRVDYGDEDSFGSGHGTARASQKRDWRREAEKAVTAFAAGVDPDEIDTTARPKSLVGV